MRRDARHTPRTARHMHLYAPRRLLLDSNALESASKVSTAHMALLDSSLEANTTAVGLAKSLQTEYENAEALTARRLLEAAREGASRGAREGQRQACSSRTSTAINRGGEADGGE